jgi:hypothetical protein
MIYKALEDPVTRQKFLLVMGSIAEILVIMVDELSGPLKEATLQFIDLGHAATLKFAKSLVSVAIDALGIVPVAGEVVEGIKFFDDVAKQVQASIDVFLKTFTLLTNLLGANLESFNNIKTRIEGSVEQIKSQLQDVNLNLPSLPSLLSLPSLDKLQSNLQNNLQGKINTGMTNLQGRINTGMTNLQGKINTGIENAIPPPPAQPEQVEQADPEQSEQSGGIKNIKKNIKKTAKRITKNLNMFYNRKYKTNMTRRHRK